MKQRFWVGTDDADRVWGFTNAFDAEEALARLLAISVKAVRDLAKGGKPIGVGTLLILRCDLLVMRAVDGSPVQVGIAAVDEYDPAANVCGVTTYVAVPHTRAGHSVFNAAIARGRARSAREVPPTAGVAQPPVLPGSSEAPSLL